MITAKSIELEKSFLLTCKILWLLVNTLVADEKYPVINRDNLTIPRQMILSEKEKTFSQFLAAFFKSRFNLKYFKEKGEPHRFCILKISESQIVVRYMPKKNLFRRPFDKQHGKCAKALLKSASEHLYNIHWSLPSQLSWKKSLLFTCKVLGLLVNTLAADEKCPVLNRDNLTIPIPMQLSPKQKWFSQFFATFLKSSLYFKYFGKKDQPHRFSISEITDSKNVVI